MTESESKDAADPLAMPAAVTATDRKFRLFAIALCRQAEVWRRLPRVCRMAVDVAERLADQQADAQELIVAAAACPRIRSARRSSNKRRLSLPGQAESLVQAAALPDGQEAASKAIHWAQNFDVLMTRQLLQCIFRNPLQPDPRFHPRWEVPALVDLAGEIYRERSFERMPALADALAASGCTDVATLTHCRTPVEHARGCWVIDLILGLA